MGNEQRYYALLDELKAAEDKTGLYLTDMAIDSECAGVSREDPTFFARCHAVACQAAGMRAEEVGEDINVIIGRVIY